MMVMTGTAIAVLTLRSAAQAPRTTLLLVFMNSFKIGVIAALIADALKLQG